MNYLQKIAENLLDYVRGFWVYMKVFGLSGVWHWFRSAMVRRPFLVSIALKNGDGLQVWLRAGTSDVEVYKKVFVDAEYQLPFEKSPRTIIDLGANIGLASVFYALAFPSADILAVEPSQDNFELLLRNIANFKNVKAVQAAAWSEDGSVNLVDPGFGPWGMQVKAASPTQQEAKVLAFTVPSLMHRHGMEHLDLLKVDIEGAEKEVFESSSAWIGQVGAVVAELHDRYKAGCSRAFFTAMQTLPNECWVGENVFVWRS